MLAGWPASSPASRRRWRSVRLEQSLFVRSVRLQRCTRRVARHRSRDSRLALPGVPTSVGRRRLCAARPAPRESLRSESPAKRGHTQEELRSEFLKRRTSTVRLEPDMVRLKPDKRRLKPSRYFSPRDPDVPCSARASALAIPGLNMKKLQSPAKAEHNVQVQKALARLPAIMTRRVIAQ